MGGAGGRARGSSSPMPPAGPCSTARATRSCAPPARPRRPAPGRP